MRNTITFNVIHEVVSIFLNCPNFAICYTTFLRRPHKKSKEMKSGELAGHSGGQIGGSLMT